MKRPKVYYIVLFGQLKRTEDHDRGSGEGYGEDIKLEACESQNEKDCPMGQNPSTNSFKSKLLNMSNPGTRSGFGTHKERLKIDEGDITISKGPCGPMMDISEDL
ncbi:hypothetical protein ACOSQ3_016719 [Xanthoceras sorbifolium]